MSGHFDVPEAAGSLEGARWISSHVQSPGESVVGALTNSVSLVPVPGPFGAGAKRASQFMCVSNV